MAKPPPSEWGKLNAGQTYQVVALDVLRALAHAGLNSYEWILVQVVMEQSWYTSARLKRSEEDWPEPVPCKLNVTEFAHALGPADEPEGDWKARRKRLYEARSHLVAARILIEAGDGLWINKDADDWVGADGISPRFAPGGLAYAMSARSRKVYERVDGSYPEKRTSMPGKTGTHARKNGHACPEKRAFSSPPLEPPIRKEIKEESQKTGMPEREPAGTVRLVDSLGDPINADAGVVNDPAELAAVADAAERLHPTRDFAGHVHAYGKTFPAAWMLRALEDSASWSDPPRSFKPVLNLLRSWMPDGPPVIVPASPAVARKAGTPARYDPPSVVRQNQISDELKAWGEAMRKESDDAG